jgi:hypothetical protein
VTVLKSSPLDAQLSVSADNDKLIALADNVMLMAWQFKANDKLITLKVCTSAVVQWRGAGCRGKNSKDLIRAVEAARTYAGGTEARR